MKILWLINIMLPKTALYYHEKVNPSGGWMVFLSEKIPETARLSICYPDRQDRRAVLNGVTYYGCKNSDTEKKLPVMIRRFEQILSEEAPDVIHIWGTEHLQSYAMTEAAKNQGMIERTAISIQGMVSYYAEHFMSALPLEGQRFASFRDWLRRDRLTDQQKNMRWRGTYEEKAVKNARHVIGRTTWDRICTELINPQAVYHFNNEILRKTFYEHRWRLDRCERYSIFVSQAQMPIKGFHFVLKAVRILKEKYPQVHVYVAGIRPPFSNGLRAMGYAKYLSRMADHYGVSAYITYVGNLDEESMCRRFLDSHVFVNASSIENSPNSVGEAMLLGMPVVASDVGGTRDMLTDKKDGYLYQYDAAYMMAGYIDRLFRDDGLAVRLGDSAREHALETHDRIRNVSELKRIYSCVAGREQIEI